MNKKKVLSLLSITFVCLSIIIGMSLYTYKENKESSLTEDLSLIPEKDKAKTQIIDKNDKLLFDFGSDINATSKKAPHYTDYVISELTKIFQDEIGFDQKPVQYFADKGYRIKTSLDLDTQVLLESVIKEKADSESFNNLIGAKNAAAVIMDPETSEIIAMVGSRDYFAQSEDNRFVPEFNAVNSLGYPNLSQPIVYLTALRGGYNAYSVLPDYKIDFKDSSSNTSYYPANKNNQYSEFGKYISLRTAAENSLYVPVIAAYMTFGKNNFVDTYIKLNNDQEIKDRIQGPSISSIQTSLLNEVHAYSTIANEGAYNDKVSIIEIKNSEGEVIYKNNKNSVQQIEKKYIYALNDIYKSTSFMKSDDLIQDIRSETDLVLIEGLGTNDFGVTSDLSVIAYSPEVVFGFWAGNSCGATQCPLEGSAAFEANLYLELIKPFLNNYRVNINPARFIRPEGISTVEECGVYDEQKNCVGKIQEFKIEGDADFNSVNQPSW